MFHSSCLSRVNAFSTHRDITSLQIYVANSCFAAFLLNIVSITCSSLSVIVTGVERFRGVVFIPINRPDVRAADSMDLQRRSPRPGDDLWSSLSSTARFIDGINADLVLTLLSRGAVDSSF